MAASWSLGFCVAACATTPIDVESVAANSRAAAPSPSAAAATPGTADVTSTGGAASDEGDPAVIPGLEPQRAAERAEVRGGAPAAVPQAPTSVLVDEQGGPLPQTDARPSVDSEAFLAGCSRLFEAIVADDADLALPFFFPVVAYEQVKDIGDPKRDWEWRLVGAFRRNVHEYHRLLGKARAQAKFLRVEVPEERVTWMKPGSEGNKVGYFRVLRSQLVYADAEGRERTLELTSFISWRGEWYVVHLHGFK